MVKFVCVTAGRKGCHLKYQGLSRVVVRLAGNGQQSCKGVGRVAEEMLE